MNTAARPRRHVAIAGVGRQTVDKIDGFVGYIEWVPAQTVRRGRSFGKRPRPQKGRPPVRLKWFVRRSGTKAIEPSPLVFRAWRSKRRCGELLRIQAKGRTLGRVLSNRQ